MRPFDDHKLGRFESDWALFFLIPVVDGHFVSNQQTYSIFIEEIPVCAFSCVSAAIGILGEVGLMEDSDWLFGIFEEPSFLVPVKHILYHFPFSCAVPSRDTDHKGFAIFDRKVSYYGAKFLQVKVLFGSFYRFGSSHALVVILAGPLLHLLKLSNQL